MLDNTLVNNRVAAFLGGPSVSLRDNRVGTDMFGNDQGNEKGGITLYGDSCNVQQNTFKYNGSWALGIAGTKSNTVYDNKIEENLVDGILLFDYTYSDEDEKNLIQRNQLFDNTNAAISDLYSNGLQVLDNEIGGNRVGVDL
ncbi:MAG: right-handed parallel beta-helix repeat-containing protein, partial [bacterium]